MIKTHEGLGGWSIDVINGDRKTSFSCSQYSSIDEYGIRWFDWDSAMRDAEALDATEQSAANDAGTGR